MLRLGFIALLCGITIGSSVSFYSFYGNPHFPNFHIPKPAHDLETAAHHAYECQDHNGCACLFYVDDVLVFRRENKSAWHSCTDWGLYQCFNYCNEIFKDEDLEYISRQNACDVLNVAINTYWYRRHQVCGEYGPYKDILLDNTLCCERGRPIDHC